MWGCIAPRVYSNGTIYCSFCNLTLNLGGFPDENGLCVCKDKYEMKDGVCVDICGDGFLMDKPHSDACDDGNR